MQHHFHGSFSPSIARVCAAAVVAGMMFASAPANAQVTVRIDIANAPPSPHVVFRSQPHEQRYTDSQIHVVDDPGLGDNDCFRYGGYYWIFEDGYWYRSADWRGPFIVYDPREVPAAFYRQHPSRWKHRPSGPPVFDRRPDHAQRSRPALMPREPLRRYPAPVPQVTPPERPRPPQVQRGDHPKPPGQAKREDQGKRKQKDRNSRDK